MFPCQGGVSRPRRPWCETAARRIGRHGIRVGVGSRDGQIRPVPCDGAPREGTWQAGMIVPDEVPWPEAIARATRCHLGSRRGHEQFLEMTAEPAVVRKVRKKNGVSESESSCDCRSKRKRLNGPGTNPSHHRTLQYHTGFLVPVPATVKHSARSWRGRRWPRLCPLRSERNLEKQGVSRSAAPIRSMFPRPLEPAGPSQPCPPPARTPPRHEGRPEPIASHWTRGSHQAACCHPASLIRRPPGRIS